MDLERCIITKVCEIRDAGQVIEAGIGPEDIKGFVRDLVTNKPVQDEGTGNDVTYRLIFGWVMEVNEAYGKPPTLDELVEEFPDFVPVPVPKPLGFYVETLLEHRQRMAFYLEVIDPVCDLIHAGRFTEARAAVREWASKDGDDGFADDQQPPVGCTYKEAKAYTPAEIPWYMPGWIAPGRLTLISGKAKEAGKTTLLARLFQKIADGEPFLGEPTTPTKIVHVSEEQLSTLMETASMVGVDDRDDVFVVSQPDHLPGASWSEIVAAGLRKALEVEAGILVFDTFANLAGLAGKDEWLPGPMLECLKPLRTVSAAHNLAVVVVFHHGHDDGHPRGSSAVIGLVDIWLALRRTTDGRERCRVITGIGRGGRIPAKLTIEADEDWEYRLTDAEQSRRERNHADDVQEVLLALEELPNLTVAEIAKETVIPLATVKRILARLNGRVWCSGTGAKGDPHRYSIIPAVTDSEGE